MTASVKTLSPGKGIHVALTATAFLTSACGEASSMLGLEGDAVLDGLEQLGWSRTEDSFGKKAYRALRLEQDTELRVTIVRRASGEFRLDIRSWFRPGSD